MDSRFDFKTLEPKIYQKWEKSGFFNPDNLVKKGIAKKTAKPFTIVLPPPNVTGILHMGSAFMLVIEDVMVRFNRMLGRKTLWLPGTDHAAIATEAVVVKQLAKEGKSKFDLGREKFLERLNDYAMQSKSTIIEQTKAMGSSLDWSREAFTLDDERNLAVRTAFKKMYEDGLIYRGNRVVNWDPKGQTTISDDEVEYEERKAKLYTLKYAKDIPIPIATTRPETKLGDTAIAVHPSDERYKKYVGNTYKAKFAGEEIELKVVTDRGIDSEFGTGALGVTPAHSIIDWQIAQANDLPVKQVIDEHTRMTVGMDGVRGEKTTIAREAVVEWLKREGLLIKEEEITQNISVSQRTGAVVEPLPKLQWFVDVNKKFKFTGKNLKGIKTGQEVTLKKLMQAVVKNGQIEILPHRFNKTYFHWIDNLRDWCISRQIWYGHRVPVWYKGEELYVGVEPPKGSGWEQDEDTLDTWFSSALWTFSTLGWPKNEEGKKISKSLGNNLDPLDMIREYGADAVRMALIIGTAPGGDSKISIDKIRGYRNFSTKIWNASRFVLSNYDPKLKAKPALSKKDKTNLEQLKKIKTRVTRGLENYKFHQAGEELYHYFWHTFADKIIEDSKKRLYEGSPADKKAAQETLMTILKECLKMLLHFSCA